MTKPYSNDITIHNIFFKRYHNMNGLKKLY